MPPNLRSVIAQCYNRGARSIGSRRNFSSDPNGVGSISSLQLPTRRKFGLFTSMCFGFSVYGYWELIPFFPKWKKNLKEVKLLKQRRKEVRRESRGQLALSDDRVSEVLGGRPNK